jgi:antitoxin (DNA-binding transcriptional repressor) of toxin-antitoxin stability system
LCYNLKYEAQLGGNTMKKLSIREMRNVLGQIDSLVNAAGELVITRHGEAIARVLPMQGKHERPTHRELHQLTGQLVTPSEKLIRDERDAR